MFDKRHFLMACVAATLAAGPVWAQNEIPPTFEFGFSNPGARSMGFGGAFVALADDATAAFANPAGLVQLGAPEVSFEIRSWSYSTPYVSGGRIWGTPTGIGEDYSTGVRTSTSNQDLTGLSFLSFVYPSGRWSFAFYRHSLSNYQFEGTTGGLYSGPWPETGALRREFAYQKGVDLQIVTYSMAAAYQVTESLSLGIAVNYFLGDVDLTTNVYGKVESNVPPEVFFAPIPLVPENLLYTASLRLDDRDWGINLGIHWKPTRHWSFGGFYREGPKFSTTSEVRAGPAAGYPELIGEVIDTDSGNARFPNVYGLGTSYRLGNDRVTLSFEWDRIEYSTLFGDDDELFIGDGDEFRLGGEYAFLDLTPIVSLRAGVWIDPDHQISYIRDEDEEDEYNYVADAVLTAGEDQMHYAAGLGLAFKRLQIDLAADFSELVDTFSLSLIYRF